MRKIKRAILYVRVSTDDQKNGYSPADQEERLLKYCLQNEIEVVKIYHEDESARDFDNRPEWQKILQHIKKTKRHGIDTILFIKWDRFSRNVAEAYITLKELKKYGVEPQAMEQPLDFEIPESKIMLAIYLSAPEVDNDRRALNTFHGMRRAKKEGRWMGTCLRGYKHTINEHAKSDRERKIVVPEGGKEQELVVKAFNLMATGMHPIDELRRKMNIEGLNVSRTQFWRLLRHQGYIGKVFIPEYKDEPAEWVQGQHEPIIDESTFYKVQDILLGRKKPCPTKNTTFKTELPLRGFLYCPQCGRKLTGSASRGKLGGRFFYYHCSKGCKERKKASEANEVFLEILQALKLDESFYELYGEIITKVFSENKEGIKEKLSELTKAIEKQKIRLKNARMLMLDGEIDAKDYKELKQEIEATLTCLQIEESELRCSQVDYKSQIDFLIYLFTNIDTLFNIADGEVKQKIIGSVFPEKLVFENRIYRTPKINPAVSLLFIGSNDLEQIKKHPVNRVLSRGVARRGIEPLIPP